MMRENGSVSTLPVAVIGGGACGLSAALALADAGISVTVFEASPQLGGLSADSTAGAARLEHIYHHMFTSDSELLNLFERFDLMDGLHWHEPANAIYKDKRLHPFTSPFDLLRFKAMPFSARVRTGILVLMARFWKNPWKLDRITAREWLIRLGGQAAYDCLWEPLLRSKFDSDAEAVSGTWIWNKFKLRGASRAKGIAKESLGYPEGGFMPLFHRMEQAILDSGGSIRTGVRVGCVDKQAEQDFVLKAESDNHGEPAADLGHYRQVLYTGAPETFPPLLDEETKRRLMHTPETHVAFGPTAIRHKANLCLRIAMDRSLSPWYWTTVADLDIPFVVLVEHTRLMGPDPYGSHQVYLSRYLDASDPLYAASDETVKTTFLAGLKRIFPDFDEACVRGTELTRSRYAQPVATVGSGSRRAPAEVDPAGLYLASMAQIWPEDRGLNYAIRAGSGIGRMMADAGQKRQVP